MATHDLVIRGGTVVDGTGAPPRTADVAIDRGRITEVGQLDATATTVIDADGALVAPGWVDIHTHFDGQVTWDPYLTPSSYMGVTTVVMGNCGVGFAPVHPDRHEWLVALMEGVEDIPGTALHEGISWGWESFPEYLDLLARGHYALDVAAQVPHSALRGYVMGDRGADHTERPTVDEIARMGELAAAGIEAGAVGFTTSRTVFHRSSDGRQGPTYTAGEDELVGIASAIGRTGKGVFEVVADLVDLEAEFDLFRHMVRASGRPMTVTFGQRPGFPHDEYTRVLKQIEAAVGDGLPLWGQVAVRPVSVIMCLEGNRHPLVQSPTYQMFAALPLSERVAELRKPETKAQIVAELSALPSGTTVMDRYQSIYALGDPPCYNPAPDASIAARAASAGVTAVELAYDVLLERNGKGMLFAPGLNYLDGNLDAVREMLTHPNTIPGLSDAGAHCTMICDASYPTFMLSYWAGAAPEGERLPVEWAVKRQCADTAAWVGLHDRGVLAPGYRADVNVIDRERLGLASPEMRYDLPAGGKRLVQRATGYVTTLVAGEMVSENGELTGARPGALVRGEQARPQG